MMPDHEFDPCPTCEICVVCDEEYAHPDREIWGRRSQPRAHLPDT